MIFTLGGSALMQVVTEAVASVQDTCGGANVAGPADYLGSDSRPACVVSV